MDPLLIKAIVWMVTVFLAEAISQRYFAFSFFGVVVDTALILWVIYSPWVGVACLTSAGLQDWASLQEVAKGLTFLPFFIGVTVGFYLESKHYKKTGRW